MIACLGSSKSGALRLRQNGIRRECWEAEEATLTDGCCLHGHNAAPPYMRGEGVGQVPRFLAACTSSVSSRKKNKHPCQVADKGGKDAFSLVRYLNAAEKIYGLTGSPKMPRHLPPKLLIHYYIGT
jgi:hypothetical protein